MPYENQPLGTIISSVLNYDVLCKELVENPAIDNTRSSYVPCDGRKIDQSRLATLTGITEAPDLRGRFLRGLNLIYSVGQPTLDISKADSDDPQSSRAIGQYQPDAIRTHYHEFSHIIQVGPNEPHNSGGGFNHNGGGSEGYNNYGNVGANLSGGTETRPKNVSVYFYIKIN